MEIDLSVTARNRLRYIIEQSKIGEQERCGALMGYRFGIAQFHIAGLHEIANVHEEPLTNFKMTNKSIADLARRTRVPLIGFWHTHPRDSDDDHLPSKEDLAGLARYSRLVGVVLHPPSSTVTWFHNNNTIHSERL